MEDKKLRQKLEKTREQLEMYRLIFESIYYGSMVTDAKGFITHFNKPYGHFLGLNPAEQIGKHCTESIEAACTLWLKPVNRRLTDLIALWDKTWLSSGF